MNILDLISYWWPAIGAILAVLYAFIGENPFLLGVAAALVVLQVVVVVFRGGLFVAREARARSAQQKYDDE